MENESCGRDLDVCEQCKRRVGADNLEEIQCGLGLSNPYPSTERLCAGCRSQVNADNHEEWERYKERCEERGESPHGSGIVWLDEGDDE